MAKVQNGRRNIAENSNRLSRAHDVTEDKLQTDGFAIANTRT